VLTLRPATAADIPTLRSLADTIWRACYPGIITPAQIDYMLARMYAAHQIEAELKNGVAWDLALENGRPAGFLAYGPPEASGSLKLHKLYLLPEFHGRGHGQQLLAHFHAAAQRAGATRVHLQVNKANGRALRAYERAGYRIERAAVADIGGGFVMDDFILVRDLADAG
jgi:ribosomal protein S18 acetylase RimI-like enzyme